MILAVSLVIGDCLTDILSSFIDDFVMNKLDTSIIQHNHSVQTTDAYCGPLLVLNTTENQLRPATQAQHGTTKSHSTFFAQFSYRFGPFSTCLQLYKKLPITNEFFFLNITCTIHIDNILAMQPNAEG